MFATSVLLGACGEEQATKENKSETTAKKVEKEQTKKEDVKTGLKDNTAVLDDINVKVLETEFIPKGTYEGQDKDQLGIIYEVKNKSDKEIDAISGWLAVFEATQDIKDTVHKLNVGGLPNLEKYTPFLDTQLDTIKKDGTLKNGIAYDLEDTTTPVILKATKGVNGEKLGEIKVNIEK
ncbi:DUF5067 domain-containing protein [Macrococcoides caseolyticum]|uniref:DUF5067 domain-containing protein n=1 Tax=Macrococcoides caseolyticum TaxID=69966 RepID=UPI0034DD0803